jgi:integrase
MTLKLKERGGVLYAAGTVEGQRVRLSTGIRVEDKAGRLAARRMATLLAARVVEGGAAEVVGTGATFGEAARLYAGRAEGMSEMQRAYVERVRGWWESVPLARMTPGWVDRELRGRLGAVKPGTLRRQVNVVGAVLGYAAARGLCGAVRLLRPEVHDAKERWLTVEERELLIDELPEEVGRLALFLVYTGARLGEALSLEWSQVLADGVVFTTLKGKSRRPRRRKVPLHPRVEALLGELRRETGGTGKVFRSSMGRGWTAHHQVDRVFKRAAVRLGWDDVTPHTLRHTFASHLVMKGVGLREVADLLGHSSMTMVVRYAHLCPTHLKGAVDRL